MPAGRPCHTALRRQYGWGIVAPVICTLIDWPLAYLLGPSSILLTYQLGVFLVASRFGRGPSFLAAVLSAAALAFFFAPPLFSFAISDLKNIIGLGVMLVVASITSKLAEDMRTQATVSALREKRASALYQLTDADSKARELQDIAVITTEKIRQEFGVAAALLYPGKDGKLLSGSEISGEYQQSFKIDVHLAQRIFDEPFLRPPGFFEVGTHGHAYFPLRGSSSVQGILVLASNFQVPQPASEEFDFFCMFMAQIAQTMERIRWSDDAREASFQIESEALRNSLLTAISHDLRTPLTRILGSASALSEQEATLTTEERLEFSTTIQNEARHMVDVMNKVLDMARLTSGRLIPHAEWNALEEILGSALARLETSLCRRTVTIDLPENLPLVKVDAVLFQQVLINLIDNAIKYTPQDSPISIKASMDDEGGMKISVADRGPGVAPADRERLFQKFHRLEPESTQTGAGLGLALCRSIMEAHHGQVCLEPREGGGSVFVIRLPVTEQPNVDHLNEAGGVAYGCL